MRIPRGEDVIVKLLFAALLGLALTSAAAAAVPQEVAFDGSRLTRATSPQPARSVSYRSAADPDFAERVDFRSVDAPDFSAALKSMIAEIRRAHPGVKLRMLQHGDAEDMLVSFIAFAGDKGVYSARRLSRTLGGLVAIVYQADFTLGLMDDDQKLKITAHTAETAVATFDAARARALAEAAE